MSNNYGNNSLSASEKAELEHTLKHAEHRLRGEPPPVETKPPTPEEIEEDEWRAAKMRQLLAREFDPNNFHVLPRRK
jgi:hypothetical protein